MKSNCNHFIKKINPVFGCYYSHLCLFLNSIDDKFKNDNFRTYITKIGLYNNKNQLIMVASLPVPVQVPKKQPLTIKVRVDF